MGSPDKQPSWKQLRYLTTLLLEVAGEKSPESSADTSELIERLVAAKEGKKDDCPL